MKIVECLQGTPEWLESRRCMITGTKLGDVMGTNLDKLMLICDLIGEEASEQSKAFKATAEMERGTLEEVFARKHFEKIKGKKVKEIGFCISDEFPFLGCSADGWIENKGVLDEAIEIKSPDTKNAVFYKLETMFTAEELGLGSYSAVTLKNPEPVFKPSAKAPWLEIPAQYQWQTVNYFLVNENLKKMYFCIYDARFLDDESKMTIVEIKRENTDLQKCMEDAKTELVEFRKTWLRYRDSIIKDNF